MDVGIAISDGVEIAREIADVTIGADSLYEIITLKAKEVLAAARLANVDKFAEKLLDQWNTLIGENGCELSGGERQRISIVRAFLKNAPIARIGQWNK